MRVHLVSLQAESYPLTTTPLAIITLGAFLRSRHNGVSVTYTDLQLSDLEADLLPALDAERPDIIGISAQYGTLRQAGLLLDRLRQEGWFDRSRVVAGNVLPTYAYPWLLERYPDLLCCVGRGEMFLLRLVSQVAKGEVDPRRLPGCAWSEAGRPTLSDANRFELELLPPADWDGLFARYTPGLYEEVWVEASRGCPHKKSGWGCTYCAIMPDAGSRDWRPRGKDSVLTELSVLARYGISHIRFADEEWMADQPERALTFSNELYGLRRELLDDGIPMPTFDMAMRVDDVIRRNRRGGNGDLLDMGAHLDHKNNHKRIEALRRLHEIGLKQIYLGIESGAAGQLRRYYKGVRPEDNELALNTLTDLGIQAACGWIMFDPMVTPAELQENVAFIRRNDLLPASPHDSFVTYPLSRMRPLEGSPSVKVLRDQDLLGPRTATIVEYEVRYEDPVVAGIVDQVVEWERGIARPALYALKNRVARMAWRDGRPPEDDRMLADLYFALKRLDLALADELSRAALNGCGESGLAAVRFRLEEERSSLVGGVRGATPILTGAADPAA
ncbi:hypothetical protein Acsp03_31480 [Actinomadura sp. NBRC 104412]|uniref:B12-binding domain-containing radical SAM protein n=1 Tax=Actinomadura sp. NBRC 104412 TaxID=3032203 RepID=UPI0024A06CC8|nr:cobalamin-dependent protein [Actinomadura sp. NBRC 104412]GLZ05682.1 hypothetical protein Acsp03_31480 [Actinomadura sp. NBRC 104412]